MRSIARGIGMAAIAAALLGCSSVQSKAQLRVYPPDASNADGYWRFESPEALGLDTAAIRDHQNLCERTGADSCLIAYKGKIVSEWYSPRYKLPVAAMSSTKSIASILIGCLVDSRKIESYDAPVGRFLPGWAGGMKSKVTIRHLLTHTSGISVPQGRSVGFEADKNGFVLGLDIANEPGTSYRYSNEGVQMLSPIIDAASGMPAEEYARRALFEPLGMNDTRLKVDSKNHAWTYADMETSTRDFARIGALVMGNGVFNGRRVVSEQYVRMATRPSAMNPDVGLLWWIMREPESLNGYAAKGYLNTDLYVFPNEKLIIARTQAPKNGYTGQPESAGYEPKAYALFKKMVHKR
jgi:CubicO group peptidase (beta-lactamase class C family)